MRPGLAWKVDQAAAGVGRLALGELFLEQTLELFWSGGFSPGGNNSKERNSISRAPVSFLPVFCPSAKLRLFQVAFVKCLSTA